MTVSTIDSIYGSTTSPTRTLVTTSATPSVMIASSTIWMYSTTTTSTENNEFVSTGPPYVLIAVACALVGVIVAVIIIATVIVACLTCTKRNHRRRALDVTNSEKTPSIDGYTYVKNALYEVRTISEDSGLDQNGKTSLAAVDLDITKNSVILNDTVKTSKICKTNAGSNNSINNKFYSEGAKQSPGTRSRCSLPGDREKEREKREGSYEYAYATTSVDRISSSTSASSLRSPQKRKFTGSTHQHSIKKENEHFFYIAPAMDENSLYAQFAEIRIRCLARETIRITDLIGSGQFGKVEQGEWMKPSSKEKVDVAVKTLKEEASEEDKIKFLQEAAIMGQFSHPNVVKLYGVVTEGEPVMIVLELLPKGDLRNHLFSIRNKQEERDEHTLLSFCRQIAAGMCYLASKSFVHRDLAARNILVSEDGICKIADFGMSRDLMDENYYISHGGKIPVKWTAPEALHFKKFSSASDVWSFGCVVFEIWSLGHKPFEEWSNNQAIMEVDDGIRMAPPPGCPRAVYELAIHCWHPERSQRPSFTDIVQLFSLPDTKLLKWSEEDRAAHPEAATLGADLDAGLELYKDLQECYVPKEESGVANNDLAASKTAPSNEQSTCSMAAVTPPTLQAEVVTHAAMPSELPVDAPHSYEDPSFLSFFLDQDARNKLSSASVDEKVAVTAVVAGDGGHSYEDAKVIEALAAEGNCRTIVDALGSTDD